MAKIGFELASSQEVWDAEVDGKHYSVFQDYDAQSDTSVITVYDDEGEPVNNEISEEIIDEYVEKDN